MRVTLSIYTDRLRHTGSLFNQAPNGESRQTRSANRPKFEVPTQAAYVWARAGAPPTARVSLLY
jgi:hypothetical protein